ncbi:MAG: YjbH domain-containing protein [Marinifilaceae bacterium]
MKKYILGLFVMLFMMHIPAFSQLSLGSTGGLMAPTAQMQESGTVMIGSNFIDQAYLPNTFHYNTYNYYVNATLFSFFEFAYTCTFFRGCEHFVPHKEGKVVNQDRQFSARFRLLRERKYLPAIVIGSNDLYSQTGGGQIFHNDKGNKYFSRFYIALGKEFNAKHIGKFTTNIAYNYSSKDISFKDLSISASYQPIFAHWINIIGEFYDNKGFYGLQITPIKYLIATITVKNKYDITTGLTLRINLKK